ncbi:hypothetical protein BRD10_04795 [Halobacteriales archaeon SW_12_71_31]|nr:MAG: hypothetical protein BRD10_04795 [Halobacteriales archaeon SW_12_71_31]
MSDRRPEADATVRADESRLRQLLENMMRNSVEHDSTSPRQAEDAVEQRSTSPQQAGDAAEHLTEADAVALSAALAVPAFGLGAGVGLALSTLQR